MAEILALVAAFFFALAATLQQKGALGMGEVSLGSPSSFVTLARQKWWLIAGALLVAGGSGSVVRKAAFYGASAGVLFGLSAALCKPTVEILGDDGLAAVLESWELYAFAAAGILAFVIQQVSLATGKLAASVATVSVCNPIVGIVIGTLLLDERLAEPTWHKAVAYSALVVALI